MPILIVVVSTVHAVLCVSYDQGLEPRLRWPEWFLECGGVLCGIANRFFICR